MTEEVVVQQGTKIEGEADEKHSNPNIAEDRYVEQAKKKGWSPEDQWRGSPEDWVPAKEFIGRQKLFDRIDSLKSALQSQKQDFEKDMKVISKAFADMNEQSYKQALKDLKAQRALAIEDKNLEAVEALDQEIDETKTKAAEAKALGDKQTQRQTQETPDFVEWRESNSWFVDNQEMRDDAIAIGVGFAAKNPNLSEKKVYDYVTGKIQKMYPEQFKRQTTEEDGNNDEGQPRSRKVSNVEQGGGNRAPATKKTNQFTENDLSDVEKQVMKTLLKRGALKDAAVKNKRSEKEEYLAQYQANRERTR